MAQLLISAAEQVGEEPTGNRNGVFFFSEDVMERIKNNRINTRIRENTNIDIKNISEVRRELKKVIVCNALTTKIKSIISESIDFLFVCPIYHNHIQKRVLKDNWTLWLPSESLIVWKCQVRITHLAVVGHPTHSTYYTLFFPWRDAAWQKEIASICLVHAFL